MINLNFDEETKNQIVTEAKRCLSCKDARCVNACPLKNDIPSMLSKVKEQKFEEAFLEDRKYNPLGVICGLVCPLEKQCESACVRGIKERPLKIGKIEAYICKYAIDNAMQEKLEDDKTENTISNNAINESVDFYKDCEYSKESKVAIIGGGPAGISCAFFLSQRKIKTTIFEKEESLGGILKYGIPDFRLDKKIVDDAIKSCINEYIDVKTNYVLVSKKYLKKIKDSKTSEENIVVNENQKDDSKIKSYTTIEELKKQGYKYIFICIGNEISKKLEIDGADNKQVLGANEFLREGTSKSKKYSNKSFVIIGGGNVAIDSARLAKRLGMDSLIVYRKLKENMPANKSEIKEAEKEGVRFIFKTNVVGINKQDESLILKFDNGKSYKTDYLIMAIGSTLNENYFEKEIAIKENGLVDVNDKLETSNENIFAGGDLIHNKSTVAWAIKNGRDVANEIMSRIKNEINN